MTPASTKKRCIRPPKRQYAWLTRLMGFIHLEILAPISYFYIKWTGEYKDPTELVFPLPFNLILKWTSGTVEEEFLSLKYAHQMGLPSPRPISYGKYRRKSWYETAPKGSILMTRIPGTTLNTVMDKISEEDSKAIANDLDKILRTIRQFSSPFGERICNVVGGDIRTVRATDMRIVPCANFEEFHKHVAWAANPHVRDYERHRETYNRLLQKKYDIVFTHGDLYAHNIMVKDGRVSGIIDWEFAGWLPEYWDLTSIYRGRQYGVIDDFVRLWKSIPINTYEEEYDSEFSLWRMTQDSWTYG